MKTLSQMTQQEKLQAILEYNPYRTERKTVLCYLLAVRRNNTKQIAYFESFGKNVRQIIRNVHIYERRLLFGYADIHIDEYGWLSGMLPIIEEIKLDSSNSIHIGKSKNGIYAVTVGWCTGTAGGDSHPSVWDEPVKEYKEAIRQGIRQLEELYKKADRYSLSDKSNYNPAVISKLKTKLLELKRQYLHSQQLTLALF